MTKDVEPNENCGFREITGLLGFCEEDWQQIRVDLLNELHSYGSHYEKI